jgi:hypothetical protein
MLPFFHQGILVFGTNSLTCGRIVRRKDVDVTPSGGGLENLPIAQEVSVLGTR